MYRGKIKDSETLMLILSISDKKVFLLTGKIEKADLVRNFFCFPERYPANSWFLLRQTA